MSSSTAANTDDRPLLLSGLAMLAVVTPAGSLLIRDAAAALPDSSWRDLHPPDADAFLGGNMDEGALGCPASVSSSA